MKLKLLLLLWLTSLSVVAQQVNFSSFNEMRSRKGAKDQYQVGLKGGTTAGDAASGLWKWDATSTAADNSSTIIGSWTVGRWVKIPTGDNDASKLQNVAPVSVIPGNLPPSKIAQDATNRFITDVLLGKLTGIATGATANDTDANLKSRTNHTGTQSPSTIATTSAAQFSSQTEKDLWNAKQPPLGFTPENGSNKSTDPALGGSDLLYPSQKAVRGAITAIDQAIRQDIPNIAKAIVDTTKKRVPFDAVRMRKTINADGDSTAVPRETYYSTVGRVDTTKRGLNIRIDSMKTALASAASGPVQRNSKEYVLASHNFISAATGGFATATSSGSVSTYTQGMPIGRLAISTGSASATGSAFLGGSNNALTMGTSVRHAWEVVYTIPTFSDTTNTFQGGIGFDQGTSDLVHFLGLEVQNASVRGVSRRSGTEQGSTPSATLQSVNTRYRARVQIVYNSSTTNYDVKFYFKQQVGFTPVTEYPWTESDVIFTRSLASGQLPSGPLAPCVISKKSKGTSGAGQLNVEQVIYSYIF